MKIKIIQATPTPDPWTEEHAAQHQAAQGPLQAALDAVNGHARSHTAKIWDIRAEAEAAEAHLESLGIYKKDRKAARRILTSGKSIKSSRYAWYRAATTVSLERGTTAWFAVDIKRTEIDNRGGSSTTYLTPEQADIAMARFGQQFEVIPQPIAQAAA